MWYLIIAEAVRFSFVFLVKALLIHAKSMWLATVFISGGYTYESNIRKRIHIVATRHDRR